VTGLLDVPRVPLATLPTPLQAAPRLSAAAGAEVWLKRDDLTGFGLGGNKVRGLEYVLADAERTGCDVLVTGGGPQSNWAMLAALAARTRGLDCVLVSFGRPVPPVGNHALAELAGATLRFTGDDDRSAVDRVVGEVAADLRAQGRTPYAVGRGGATGIGALGYVAAGLELAGQLHRTGLRPAQLWLATGSCGTHAGLSAAQAWLRPGYEVVGVTVSRPAAECRERVRRIADEAAALIGTPLVPTQLLEMGADIALAAVLTWLWRRGKAPDGSVFWWYMILYSAARAVIEHWRGDTIRGLWFGGALSTSQILSAVAILLGIAMLVRGRIRARPAAA